MALPQKKKDNGSLKKVMLFLFLVLLGFGIYKIYYSYTNYSHVERLDYKIAPTIDENYFDKIELATYKNNAIALSKMARELWIEHRIDVSEKNPDVCKKGSLAYQEYLLLFNQTKTIEQKLTSSKELKNNESLNNSAIKEILENDYTIGVYYTQNEARQSYNFLKGKNTRKGSAPAEIWELQKLLNYKEFDITVDGIFNIQTDSALVSFQKSNNLYPSHICDDITLEKLAE